MQEETAQNTFGFNHSPSRWLLAALIFLLVVAALALLKYRQVSAAIAFAESLPERSESVTAVVAQPSTLPILFTTIGELRSTQYLQLRNEVGGKITAINFEGGDIVAEGQILIELDSEEEAAQLRATRAQLALAELQLKRALDLQKKNLASKNDVDIARADKDVLIANAAALEAAIAKKTLAAPFAAKTDVHNLQIGQFLSANTQITDLNGTQGMYWVDFELPQEKAIVEAGDEIVVSSEQLLDAPRSVRIERAEGRIDSESRTRAYRALLAGDDTALSAGAVVNVTVTLGAHEDVYELPLTAVRKSQFGAYAYVLEAAEDGAAASYRARQRQLSVTSYDSDSVFVKGGLEPGDLVAGLGAFKLSEGLLVNVVNRTDLASRKVAGTEEPSQPRTELSPDEQGRQ